MAWVALVTWRPSIWLLVLPAALPLLNFSPWTGWLVFDEFDMLVLATLAGGYLRLAVEVRRDGGVVAAPRWPSPEVLLALLLVLLSAVGLARGLADAGPGFGWFQSYAEPMNSVRLFKAPVMALLLWTLLRRQVRGPASRGVNRFFFGMLLGLAVVTAAVGWERLAHPGLWDFSSLYRTTALFWEMHVGGAAIDAYLAMAMPFIVWALWAARSPLQWALAAALALAAVYACLTTFSRGAYMAVIVSLGVLGLWLLGRRIGFRARALLGRGLSAAAVLLLTGTALFVVLEVFGSLGVLALLALVAASYALFHKRLAGWRSAAGLGLMLALTLEVVTVFSTGNFMLSRLAAADKDFGNRVAHWQNGLGLLVTPGEWLWGIGLGRLPASYARFVPKREFSGAVEWRALPDGGAAVTLSGPKTQARLGGLFALTQRVPLTAAARYQVELDLRVFSSTTLLISVCEMHLLYERDCQAARTVIRPGESSWQQLELPLRGPDLSPGARFAPRLALFALSIENAGAQADIRRVRLTTGAADNLLRNADFSNHLAHWWPAAQLYFLPWHIDNLFLELLIERGLAGLAVVVALVGLALWRLGSAPFRWHPAAPFVAASILGAVTVGMVSSLMDVPRVALLFFLMVFLALSLDGRDRPQSS